MIDELQVQVRFFATLKELAGVEQKTLRLESGANVAEFKVQLKRALPSLPESGSGILVAIGKNYAFDHEIIPQGAEITVFPPVSGG